MCYVIITPTVTSIKDPRLPSPMESAALLYELKRILHEAPLVSNTCDLISAIL